MANKKVIEERQRKLKEQEATRRVRLIGIVVAVVVVLFVGYTVIRNRGQAQPETPLATVPPALEPAITEPVAPPANFKQYDAPPEMTIDESKKYLATFKMANGGEFVIELFADKTPITVNNFVFLARDGFYDGLTFHRVIEGFMAQGGDPAGDGTGGPGYSFEDEFRDDLVFDKAGLLAMANSGPSTNGSQFFITFGPTEWLNGAHTIFGQVIEGMDVVSTITRSEPGSGVPADVIETITIIEE